MIIPLSGAAARVTSALRAHEAVVAPLPSPLPYGVTATSAPAVNRAKGRPEGQPVGIVVGDFDEVAPFLAVEHATQELITWMCTQQQLNVFAPLTGDAPAWLAQDRARTGGYTGLMGAWLPELRSVLDELGHLFVSSANPTAREPGTTAREVDRLFGERLLVVDGDAARDPDRHHGSATIVRVSPAGDLSLARNGVNDEEFTGTASYLHELRRRFGEFSAR